MATGRFSPASKFKEENIEKVPKKPPLVYKLKDQAGINIYTGSAKSGRGPKRLQEHLPGGPDPILGATFQVKLMPSIKEAREEELRIIQREHPKYNEQG